MLESSPPQPPLGPPTTRRRLQSDREGVVSRAAMAAAGSDAGMADRVMQHENGRAKITVQARLQSLASLGG